MALGLFALIALAGFALLRAVLDAQGRTEARLARLSEIQRALFVVATDLDQVSGQMEGGPDALVFQKTDTSGRPYVIAYGSSGGALTRTVSSASGERTQTLLNRVTQARWSYRVAGLGWSPVTPPPRPAVAPPGPLPATGAAAPPPPVVRAVALDLSLVGPDGRPSQARRVVATPEIAP